MPTEISQITVSDGLDWGDWTVDIDEEVPDHVKVQFSEIDIEGGIQHISYLPPDIAEEFANAILERVKWIRDE